jgi:PAS domain S-box-containing protein
MNDHISFNQEQFNRLFPFYLQIDEKLHIAAMGSSLKKLYTSLRIGDMFGDVFSINRPYTSLSTFHSLLAIQHQLVVLDYKDSTMPPLRGQFEMLKEKNILLFVGSPFFRSIEEVLAKNLYISDFAPHDPQIDLLHLLKAQEITGDDLKHLAETANRQKNELKKANKEISDIALFPMQNPDPIIRINFNGDVLQNNPAASVLDFLNYDNEHYRNDLFFKLIAEKIGHSDQQLTIEASTETTDYSFRCIPMVQEGYINIYARDITRQNADKQQIERLAKVASANNNGVVFTTAEGIIFWCNEGLERLSGYAKEEIIGKTPVKLLKGPLTDKAVLHSMVEEVAAQKPFSNEMIQYRKDGSWFWGKSKGQPVKNSDGSTSYFAIIENITAEKEQEEQLRILSSIAAENTHGVVIADAKGCVEWVNKSFEKITGYTLAEMKGKKPGHVLQGKETDQKTVAYIKEQIEKGEPFVCEILNYHKNSTTYWLRLQGQALKDKYGNITKFFAIEEDITKEKMIAEQLKQFEQKFRLALEKIGDNVWEHDFRTGITRFSKADNNLLRVPHNKEKNLDELWWQSIHKDDIHKVELNDKLYRNGEIDHHTLEYRIVQADGHVKWVLDRGVVLEKDFKKKPVLIIGTHTDITNQKTIEQQLTKAKNAAELSKKAKEIFLANMSHEIRTPLNAIIGMGNQLRKSLLNGQQQFQLHTINTAADNLLVIINDILDLSKIEAGKLTVEKIGFEPKKVVGHAMQVLMHKAEEKGLSLTNSFCDNRLAPVFIGDPYRLNQVLLNLISNAIKFTEHGSVDVRCTVTKDAPDMQLVEATVQDTGIGMEEEYVSRLFEKFSQEYESVTRKFGGTGLGMSICKELIDLMDGEIRVTSSKGKGTTVSFSIPFAKGTPKDIPATSNETISDNFLDGKTILVADDNEMNRLVAATILTSFGAVVQEATNGQEALEQLAKNKNLHLVLMDIQMPVMNGYDAAKKIRETGNKVPLIALTATALRGENEKCLKAGMNDFISKPFKEEVFLRKIAHWLHHETKEKKGTSSKTSKTKSNINSEQLYSLEGLREISRDNPAFVKKMINLFCEQATESVQEIKKAFDGADYEKMGALAHKLKPSIDNLRITSLMQPIRDIEKAGKEKNVNEAIPVKIEHTINTISIIVEQLKQEFPV